MHDVYEIRWGAEKCSVQTKKQENHCPAAYRPDPYAASPHFLLQVLVLLMCVIAVVAGACLYFFLRDDGCRFLS
jgi:hypothetical protein